MPGVTLNSEEDPLVSFHFSVEVQGQVIGNFTECSGIGSETEKIEHKVVGPNGQQMVLMIPGRTKWEDISLKRGVTSNMDIWNWRKEVEQGNVASARRNGSIVMYDQTGGEVARWNFERGWPSKVSGPQPKSDSNEITLEELTIVHEYIERVS